MNPSSPDTPAPADSAPPKIAALFVTLGLARPGAAGLVEALEADVRLVAPEFLGLLCSPDSVRTAERLVDALGADAPRYEVRVLPEAFDLDETFAAMNSFIRAVRDEHAIRPDQIAINYTSGTKVMAAGALLSGIFSEVEALRYLQASAEGDDGVSVPTVTKPRRLYALRDAQTARRLARELRFQSAADLLREAETATASADEDAEKPRPDFDALRRFRRLVEGFGAWDSFAYEAANVAFRRAREIDPAESAWRGFSADFEPEEETEALLGRVVQAVEGQRFDLAVLADLHNNALRRLHEQKSNDAVGRAYRGLEMLAQHTLVARHGIDPSHVDVRRVPPRNRPAFEAARSADDGRLRVGMRRSYELLRLLNDRLGLRFAENNEMRELLGCRYKSILAHGYSSLTMAEARAIVAESGGLIASEFDEFPALCRALQFPWMREKGGAPAAE